MKRFINITLVLGLIMILDTSGLFAQQDPMFTQYFFNPLSVNSGYAGSRDALNVTLLAREQWVGINGRPRTQSLSVHSPLGNENLAIGGSFLRDQLGPVQTNGIYADFAYRMRVTENSRLAFGLKAGINMFSAELSDVIGTDINDANFAQNLKNTPLPNFGVSAYWWSDNYFLGISAPKLLENDLDESQVLQQSKERRHFFLMGGYVFTLSEVLKFKPTFNTKIVSGSPVSVDLTANFLIDEKLWIGGMYRIGDALGLLLSYQITDQLRAGYSYDYTLTDLTGYNSGSHEIMLSYDFIFKREKTLSPRYF